MKRGMQIALVVAGILAGTALGGLLCHIYLAEHSDEVRLIDPDDIVKMKEVLNPPKPRDVMFIEVTLTGQIDQKHIPNPVHISYSRVGDYWLKDGENIKWLVNRVIRGDHIPNWHTPNYNTQGNNLTGLSLESKEARYLVFVLNCSNCQFVKGSLPFRVQVKKDKYHFNPRVAWVTHTNDIKHDLKPDAMAKAKIGYFVARSDKDVSDHNGTSRSAFNIYLELTYNNGDVPISVDPDVGYPGGNYP